MHQRIKHNGPILCISDDQAPYGHRDRFDFILTLKDWLEREYGKVLPVHLGDEVDQHTYSVHDTDPNLHGTLGEEAAAQADLDLWEEIFPKLHLVSSNHAIRVFKKIHRAGVTDRWIRTFADAWNKPGWSWSKEIWVEHCGKLININHGQGKTAFTKAKNLGCCVIQGHRHTEGYVQFFDNGRELLWGAQGGCLIDRSSRAYLYAANSEFKQVLGTVYVADGIANFAPMVLNNKGRWIGRLV